MLKMCQILAGACTSLPFQKLVKLLILSQLQYTIKVDMKRPLLAKDLGKTVEFIVEYKEQKEKAKPSPVPFTITPESLQNVKDVSIGLGYLCRGVGVGCGSVAMCLGKKSVHREIMPLWEVP